ncbi:MAG: putative porin [Planctomycetota bacterium]|nr:putative porin [Planctomycetota bacterium]
MSKVKSLLVVLTLVCAASICQAESGPGNEERVEKLEAALAAMQAELAALKAEQAKAAEVPVDPKQIDAMVGKAIDQKKADFKLTPDWLNNVAVKGDFRYRHEWKDDESRTDDRNRHRIRARLGIYGRANEEVDVGFRLASGNNAAPTGDSEGSPASINQDLTNAFSSKNIWLDLAYFDYHPADIKGFKVLGGKIANPYFRVGKNDLMFDCDVNPEGVAATYKTELSDSLDVFGTAGGYYVEERSTQGDTGLLAVQAGATHKFPDMEQAYVTAGGGYYDYGQIRGKAELGSVANQFYGNKNTGGADPRYDSDFDIAQAFAEAGFPINGLPFKVFGDYLKNTSAKSSEDTGFLLGASIGKCKKPGNWRFAYNYRELDADAVIGVLTEVTFGGGGSNVKGHTLCFGYQLAKNFQLAASYFSAERTRTTTTDHDVVLMDLKAKF